MEAEVAGILGPKGKHNPNRAARRHGSEKRSLVLEKLRVAIRRPRIRTTNGREVRLKTYEAFQNESLITQSVLERILYGLSTRYYEHGLEFIGEGMASQETSKSSISRRFIQGTRKALRANGQVIRGEAFLSLNDRWRGVR